MLKGRIWSSLGVAPHFDSNHALVTSPVFSPLTLAVIRLTLAVYTLVDFITHLAYLGATVPSSAEASSKASGCVYFISL